ncbi:MAG: type 4a pilus biogenesis protein PilO [Syntrophobacteraceae bacterium]
MNVNLFPLNALRDKIAPLSTAHRMLAIFATVAVIAALFYYFQYQPQSDVLRKVKLEISDNEKKLVSLKQAVVQVEALKKDLAKSEEEFAHMLSFLPDQKEIPGLLENVSQLGSEVGLENILFQPQPEQSREFYAAIPIRLDLIGTYHELGVFLDKVSKLDRILKVENLTMSRSKDSSTLQVGCTLVTYRFVDKPAQPEAPKKK